MVFGDPICNYVFKAKNRVLKAVWHLGITKVPFSWSYYMSTIRDCAIVYHELLNKKYNFTLEGNIKFTLEFNPAYFYHLLGLEKLTDIAQFKGRKPAKIFKDIYSGKISDKIIHNSKHYHLIEDRIQHFDQLPNLLHFDKSNKIIIDFDRSKLSFNSYLKNTKYILYKRIDVKYIHLTIGNKAVLYPETFIVENGSTYVSEQIMLDILNIDIIERQQGKS